MSDLDLDDFAQWLVSQPDVPADRRSTYVRGAARIAEVAGGTRILPKHVDEAIRRAESEGRSAAELAELQRVGLAAIRYARERPATTPPAALDLEPVRVPPAKPPAFMPGRSFRNMSVAETGVEAGSGLCPSCGGQCYVDYWQGIGKKLGFVGGILTLVSFFVCGCLGAGALVSGIAGALFLIGGMVLSIRCTHCGRKMAPEEASSADRQEALSTRMKLIGSGIGLLVLAGALTIVSFVVGVALLRNGPTHMPATDPRDVFPAQQPGRRFVPDDEREPTPPRPWGH